MESKYCSYARREMGQLPGIQLKPKPNQRKQTSKLKVHYWLVITLENSSTLAPLPRVHTSAMPYLVFCISKPAAPKSNRIHVGPWTRIAAWKISNDNIEKLLNRFSVGASYFYAKKMEQSNAFIFSSFT